MARLPARPTLALAAALLLASACSSDGDDGGAGPTTGPDRTPPVVSISNDPAATMAPSDTSDLPPITPLDTSDLPSATPLDTSDLPASDTTIEGCPVGDWYASQEELQRFYDTVGARAAVSFLFDGDAELRLRGDGTLSYVLEEFVLQQEAGGTRVDVRLTGSIDGRYTVSGSVLRATDIEPNLATEAYVDDEPIDASTLTDSIVSQFPFNDATYQCRDDLLVMDVPVLGTTHEITLTAIS